MKDKLYTFQYYALNDDEIVYMGSVQDFTRLFKVSGENINNAIRFSEKVRGYTIVKKLVKREELQRLMFNGEVEKTINNKTLDYLVRHLNRYDNTCLGKMKEYKVINLMNELMKVGIKARYKKIRSYEDNDTRYLITKCK